MTTVVYMVRHAESTYTSGNERARGLSAKGLADAEAAADILAEEGIEVLLSSPYTRAVQTLAALAKRLDIEIELVEDLKERLLADQNMEISNEEFVAAIAKVFTDVEFALPGGESNKAAQARAAAVFNQVLQKHKGKRIAVGTHGNIMTLIMNYFDNGYGLEFWKNTTRPDIYRMTFNDELRLYSVERLWK